jgi:hypothetical protein
MEVGFQASSIRRVWWIVGENFYSHFVEILQRANLNQRLPSFRKNIPGMDIVGATRCKKFLNQTRRILFMLAARWADE